MPGKRASKNRAKRAKPRALPRPAARPSALVDTRIVYGGDACVDVIYIDPPFNSNRNYEVFWGETKDRPFESNRV